MHKYSKEIPFPETKFFTSIANLNEKEELDSIPSVAFMGRSNSGKSSLLNALSNHKGLAKVSRTPGKTKLINIFKTKEGFNLIDLPGFGYSKASHKEHKDMMKLLEGFLNTWTKLKILFILCDSQREFPEEELSTIEVAMEKKIKPVVIRTKIDKLNQSEQHRVRTEMESAMNEIGIPFRVFYISSTTGRGIGELREFIVENMVNQTKVSK
ncbi:ribosome biogenesis GTP-binding protein YihA/YsxC [Leptospira sp. 2 VSF19]|uniref:Probable GTP-binding protein EngB n=1 Tax=Leptospira soteropolitanensis TaxID=2950025 RepID=A0AAW5VJI5_9LEPT|nr:ribosome biogenesis GTP-binding protein YihA/YsxC [Leptospira soteropolitanensis]MCW7494038.1 ribosome biogenesis GTP-binding protein YihA/YsxC [Leptospira soteropolitanensis]MCW7501696.1 ribosome biogenesis GTP-binding protein YihA/YsxC [Leptospira soteropolitanensis]MCW7523884.1 ribosome biogenesis GTP-binding protein YihA/YsxC [Leptospira soteropolitanensis]MCW7527749.1 ribosome biogenesis GTP-binding protein YihA/YsxC [Leptospira soteropolitanensis]MCW7531666.1 ribosome biogenesis GTP-b